MLDLPPSGATERQVTTAVRQLIQGRNNAVGTVTLESGVPTTTVTGPLINANGFVWLTPISAAAADTSWHISEIVAGSFTITHDDSDDITNVVNVVDANGDQIIDFNSDEIIGGDAGAGRRFAYVVLGG
jgi:hypothetical protein